MATSTSRIKLEVHGTDQTGAMFARLRQQLAQTEQQVRRVQQAGSQSASQRLNGVGSALQNIAAIAGGGRVASLIGQVKSLTSAAASLGPALSALLPIIITLVAAYKAWKYGQSKVAEAQKEAQEAFAEMQRTTVAGIKAVNAAYDEQTARINAARKAADALRAAQDATRAATLADYEARAGLAGLQRQLAAETEEEREAIAREVAETIAANRYANARDTAAEAVEAAIRAERRNEADIERLGRQLTAARTGLGMLSNSGQRNTDAYRNQRREIEKIQAAIEDAERRRKTLAEQRFAAEVRAQTVETARQRELLQAQLEQRRRVEEENRKNAEAAQKRAEKLADIERRRAADLLAASQSAEKTVRDTYAAEARRMLEANLGGARVMDAADVARFQALTTGANAQFQRTANGLAMVGPGGRTEDIRWRDTRAYQTEMMRLVSNINDKYNREAATVEGEI